jgi:hypothetical protein
MWSLFLIGHLVEWYLILIMTIVMNGHQKDTGSERIGACAHNRLIILGWIVSTVECSCATT